jgi:hypothetical protein
MRVVVAANRRLVNHPAITLTLPRQRHSRESDISIVLLTNMEP